MMGVTTEPEAVYEPIEDMDEIKAVERYESCTYAEICDRATELHSVESTWNYMSCEQCKLYKKEDE